MGEQEEFLNTIRFFCRKINLARFLDKLTSALFVGAGVGLLFQAAAFLLPFYYVDLYTLSAVALAAVTALAVAFSKRCSMEGAALVMDSFGFQERIVTAYEHLGEEGGLAKLQRSDAMKRLKEGREKIRIRLLPSRKRLLMLAVLLILLPILSHMPSAVKDQAKQIHFVKREVVKKQEEIDEAIEGLEEIREQSEQELTQEQLAALQEMIDSLNSSRSEYSQAISTEALAAAGEKLDFKYGDMGSQLSQLADSLQSGATVSSASVQSIQDMADRFQEMGGQTSQGSMVADGGQSQDNGGEDQTGDSQGSGTHVSESGSNNGQGNAGGGIGSGQETGAGDSSADGQGGSGESAGGEFGGEGTMGSGTDSAQGSGDGSGAGRGEGSSTATHDYVSVPNAVADSGALTGNATGHEDSDYYRTQNGLSWEGQHVSHEAVIGSYEQRAYEGISAGRYPQGMENVIKEYFSSFGTY